MTKSAHQHARTSEQFACPLLGCPEICIGESLCQHSCSQVLCWQIYMFQRLFTSTLTWTAVLTEVCHQDDAEHAAQHCKRVHLRAQLQVVICEDLHQRCLTQAGQAYSVGQLAIKLHHLLKVMPQKVPC